MLDNSTEMYYSLNKSKSVLKKGGTMKAGIFYFSGTGNTFRVAEVFGNYLKQLGYNIDYIDVAKKNQTIDDYELLVFGSPTYSKVASQKVVDFIKNFEFNDLSNTKAITFITHSWGEAYGHIVMADELSNKGIEVISSLALLMPNNHYALTGKRNNDEEMTKMYKEVVSRIHLVINSVDTGPKIFDQRGKVKKSAFKQLNKILRKKWIPNYGTNYLTINDDICVGCNLCVQKCPTQNIVSSVSKIEMLDKCLACVKCYNACPVNAFLVNGKQIRPYTENQISIHERLD